LELRCPRGRAIILRVSSLNRHPHSLQDGQPLSPKEYLEQCLAPAPGFSSDVTARNRTRRVLTAFFKDRDCVTLVRPLEDEAKLQQMDRLEDKQLRPQFRKEMRALRAHLFHDVRGVRRGAGRPAARVCAALVPPPSARLIVHPTTVVHLLFPARRSCCGPRRCRASS
jgi:hypothetical protein